MNGRIKAKYYERKNNNKNKILIEILQNWGSVGSPFYTIRFLNSVVLFIS